jgi:hypothetical protein
VPTKYLANVLAYPGNPAIKTFSVRQPAAITNPSPKTVPLFWKLNPLPDGFFRKTAFASTQSRQVHFDLSRPLPSASSRKL